MLHHFQDDAQTHSSLAFVQSCLGDCLGVENRATGKSFTGDQESQIIDQTFLQLIQPTGSSERRVSEPDD